MIDQLISQMFEMLVTFYIATTYWAFWMKRPIRSTFPVKPLQTNDVNSISQPEKRA